MKIKKGFKVKSICGENLLMGMGEENVDFTNVIALNETSMFIWTKMQEGLDSIDSLTKALTEEYEVDEATAKKDIEALVNQLTELGVLE